MSRYDPNPFDEEEVNPFAVSVPSLLAASDRYKSGRFWITWLPFDVLLLISEFSRLNVGFFGWLSLCLENVEAIASTVSVLVRS